MNTPESPKTSCPHYEKCKAVKNLYALDEVVARDQEYLAKRLDLINESEERGKRHEDVKASIDLDMAEYLFEQVAAGEITCEEAQSQLEDYDAFKKEMEADLSVIANDSSRGLYDTLAKSGVFSKKQLDDLNDYNLSPKEKRNRQIEKLDNAIEFKAKLTKLADELIANCPGEASSLQQMVQSLRQTFLIRSTISSVHFMHVCPNRELIRGMKELKKEPWAEDNSENADFWLPHRLD